MKRHRGIRERLAEAENLEMLGRVPWRRQLRHDDESEPLVVAMVAEEHTSLGAVLAYGSKTRTDELAAHASPLELRLDRHGAEHEPSRLRRGPHVGERDVTDDLP